MAARITTLRSYLAVCGINDTGPIADRQTTELITSQGFTAIDDFNGLPQSDIGRLVKAFNSNAATTGPIGFMAQKKLEALAFWVTNQKMRNIPLAIANWNADALERARIDSDIAAEQKANPQTPKRPGKIATGLDWYTWIEQFTNYLAAIRGVSDVPLTYVIRKDKPAGWDPVADISSPEETLIYQVAVTGAACEADNRTVFTKIMEVTVGETAYEWIRQFEETKDGRGAMTALRLHCEGKDFTELRITEADRILREATYSNERHFSFENYATLLQKAYTTYEQSDQVYPDRAKVKRLLERINVPNNFMISHAKEYVSDNLADDWIQAVNYLKTKVAQAFPGANRPSNRNDRRFVSEANAGRGRGRGRGGRFGRGGGRFGRGRGRGGRDGGRGSQDDDAAIPKKINGVNTSNIFRNYSDEEWAALGSEWQRKIRERRDAAKAREVERYGGPRDRSAYAAHNWRRNQDGTPQKVIPDALGSDSDEAKTDKGGTAGNNFGRNAYNKGNRTVHAIVSGPRTLCRSSKVQRTTSAYTHKPDHIDGTMAKCELDTRADTICAGKNFRVLSLTGQTCDVSGFHQSFGAIHDIPVAQVATAMTLENGETVILIINEALYFGDQMDHSLINPNQIRAYGIVVSDNPYDRERDFGIQHDDCFVPFSTEGSTVYFDTFVPTDHQIETLRHIELTSDEEWDPSTVNMQQHQPRGTSRFVQQMRRNPLSRNEAETDLHLSSISECFCPSTFAQRLIESVHVDNRYFSDKTDNRYAAEVVSNTRHSVITPERVSQVLVLA